MLTDDTIRALAPLLRNVTSLEDDGLDMSADKNHYDCKSLLACQIYSVKDRLLHVLYPSGAIVMYNVEKLRQVGYYDEEIFMYYEDNDICARINDHNYRICICPDAIALHKTSSSVGHSAKPNEYLWWHLQWSELYYTSKRKGARYGKAKAMKYVLRNTAAIIGRRLRKVFVQSLPHEDPKHRDARYFASLSFLFGRRAFDGSGNPNYYEA